MLSAREAFKVAFLRGCANQGLTVKEAHDAVKRTLNVAKSANITELLTGPYKTMLNVAGDTASNIGGLGLAGAVVGPPALGFGAGYGLSRLTDVDDEAADDVKTRELINEHRRLTEILRQAANKRR